MAGRSNGFRTSCVGCYGGATYVGGCGTSVLETRGDDTPHEHEDV